MRGRTRSSRTTRWSRRWSGKIGRAETAIDPAPMNMAETVVVFKPKNRVA